eukprot:sb/3470155/
MSQYTSAAKCHCLPPSFKTGPCPNTALPRITTVFPRLLKQIPIQVQLCQELLLCPRPNTALPRIATVFPRLLKQIPVPLQLCHELLLCSPRSKTRSLSQYSSATNCYCVPPPSKKSPCPSEALPRIATVFLRLLKQIPIPTQAATNCYCVPPSSKNRSLSQYSSATNCYCIPPPSKTGPYSSTALPRIATVILRLLKQVPTEPKRTKPSFS